MFLDAGDPHHWYSDRNEFRVVIRLIAYPLVFAWIAIAGWRHKRKQRIALEWPSVKGRVQFVDVAPTEGGTYTVTFQYSYFAEEYRSGSCDREFKSEEEANSFAQLMKDKKVPIHYNPRNPDDSVFEDEDVEEFARQTPLLG